VAEQQRAQREQLPDAAGQLPQLCVVAHVQQPQAGQRRQGKGRLGQRVVAEAELLGGGRRLGGWRERGHRSGRHAQHPRHQRDPHH
jgi:hypothetical protein